MKIFATGAIALSAAMISAAPAAAQYGGGYGQSAPPPPPTVPSIPNTMPQPQASEQPSLKISKEAMKAIVELQKAVTANDFANVPAKAQAALAVAKTKEDRYAIAQLQLKAAVTASDDAGAAAAIDAIAGTQYLAADKVADLYSAVGVNFYKAKKFDEAAAQFQKSAALAPQNAKPLTLLAEARRAQGRGADASAALQKAMQLSRAAGQTPEEDLFKTAVSLAYEARSPNAIDVARQWVAAYPSPTSWRNALAIYRNMTHPDVEATLDILRLMNATGAMTEANDYELYSTAAAEQGNYVEALAVLNNGVAAKRIDPAGSQFRDLIAGLKAKPQATEADLAEAAKTAPAAKTLIGIGDRYYGLGNYAKAAETYRAALAKPDANADIANLHIGMALARAGDKAGAAAAFGKVGGALTEVAKYWLLYVQGRA